MIHNKRGSDDFRTVVHILLGTIFFIIIGVVTMFFITGQDIQAVFEAGAIEGDKIATRIIFSRNCLAKDQRFVADWYQSLDPETRNESNLVRLGIVDVSKFNAATIESCVGYTITDRYKYILDLGPPWGFIEPDGITGDGSVCPVGTSIHRKKAYPVIIYDSGTYQNGVLRMDITFCYFNETVG